MSKSLLAFVFLVAVLASLVLLSASFSSRFVFAGDIVAVVDDDTPILPGEQEYEEKPEFSNILVKHPHADEKPSDDADSKLTPHEAMRCHVCRHAVKPALIDAVKAKAGAVDSKELVDSVLRELAHKHIYDLESKSIILRDIPEEKKFTDLERDENIHNFIEHLLWDEHIACSLYALADVYVQQPRRRHWFARLVDHVICPCHNGKEIMRLDHGIDKYLMNHIAATMEAMKRYKMGHELFDNVHFQTTTNKVDMLGLSEEDKKKDSRATNVGTIWVDADGHLDEKVQQEHEMQPIQSGPGAHDNQGHDAWTL